MKLSQWIFLTSTLCVLIVGCKEGDPTELKEAVRLAALNISSITVTPADGTITTGNSFKFTATGHRPDGSTLDVSNSVTWSSSNETVATVDSSGNVATLIDGSIMISASVSSIVGSTSLTASSAALQSIAIFADTSTPNDLTMPECKSLQLKAIGTYEGESGPRDTTPITSDVTWSVQVGEGNFTGQGLLNSRASGSIDVQASLNTVNGNATVTATADLTSIAITPASATLSKDATLQYEASGTYTDSSTADITDTVNWTSGTDTVANFNTPATNGLITGLAAGSTIVTAACGTSPNTGTANLTVTEATVNSIRFEDEDGQQINPIDLAVGVVDFQVLLNEVLSDGSTRDITENAQWSVVNNTGSIVSVKNTSGDKGKVSAIAEGNGAVQATYQNTDYILLVNVLP